jgi:hypothetical protein
MADASQHPARSALSMTVTVSSQPAFVPMLEALATRAGEYVGCPAEDARRLGEAVRRALGDSWRHLGPERRPGRYDIVFQGNTRLLRVDLTCKSPLPDGVTLEQALGGPEALEGLRHLVDRIEFGDTDGRPFCRLTRQIRDHR